MFDSLKRENALEFEQLPMLQLTTGEQLCQTKAILRMLGSQYGYYEIAEPKDAWKIDSIVDSVADALAKVSTFTTLENGPAKIALKTSYITKELPSWLDTLEKRIDNNNKWICSQDKMTIADFCLGGFLVSFMANEENQNYFIFGHILSKYPKLVQYLADFRLENEAYLSQRPPRPL